jgi:hypothetical protein
MPATQVVPYEHGEPQPPQLSWSLCVSTQPSGGQQASVEAQGEPPTHVWAQAPPAQAPGPWNEHALPQPPQLRALLAVSTQPSSQQIRPATQPEPAWHVPLAHAHEAQSVE